jgi:hypothetical protein
MAGSLRFGPKRGGQIRPGSASVPYIREGLPTRHNASRSIVRLPTRNKYDAQIRTQLDSPLKGPPVKAIPAHCLRSRLSVYCWPIKDTE